jgi:hypothetical protein
MEDGNPLILITLKYMPYQPYARYSQLNISQENVSDLYLEMKCWLIKYKSSYLLK